MDELSYSLHRPSGISFAKNFINEYEITDDRDNIVYPGDFIYCDDSVCRVDGIGLFDMDATGLQILCDNGRLIGEKESFVKLLSYDLSEFKTHVEGLSLDTDLNKVITELVQKIFE